ncbi:MAG: Calx-beta domain-containing protein, partial [Acidimicrobiia bacterium]
MDGSRTIGGLRRFAVLFLTAAIMAGGLIGVGATSSSAADPVATPYIFAPPSTVVGEASGSVTLPVTLSAPGTSTVTVNYSVPGGGCNNLNQGSSGTLTFTPGVVSRNVTVTINNCNVKGKAFFTLTLSSAVNGIIAQATTQVDIVGDNNLQATPGLYVKDAVADTSAGTVQVPVLLGGPGGATSASTVTVHYTTANGSAVAGTDYTLTSGNLTFAPGQTVATVTVPIVNRVSLATARSFSVVLSAPTNAAIIGGTGVVTIGASGGSNVATPFVFAPPNTVVGEADGWVDLPVTLSAPSASLVTVAYAVPGGGCNNLNQGSSGTVSFTPGVVLKVVRVQINDCQVAGKSFFTLTLSSAVNGIIAQATTQVDVVGDNNLQATPGLYVKDAVADTSAGTVQVPVLLGGPGGATSAGTVTVHFTTANGSAVA